MNDLVLSSESLNKILESNPPSIAEIFDIYQEATNNPSELFTTARRIREKHKGVNVTFSKKAFFNIINMCRDTCSYCTYKSEPGEEKLSLMSKQDIKNMLILAKK